jgi:hypothetical protein
MTLGEYRKLAIIIGHGEDNAAVKFFDEKIAKFGPDDKVLAHESQMLMLIYSLLKKSWC